MLILGFLEPIMMISYFHELDRVDVIRDLPLEGLKEGDTGTVVGVHDEPTEAYTVEFLNPDGTQRALCTLPLELLRPAIGPQPPPVSVFAVFAGCSLSLDAALSHSQKALGGRGWSPRGEPVRLNYGYDAERGLYVASKALSFTEWEATFPSYTQWEGLGLAFSGHGELTFEVVRPEPQMGRPAVAILGETAAAFARQKSSEYEATRWAGLLMDLFEGLGAVRCAVAPDLRDLDLGSRREFPKDASLLILGKDDQLARGLQKSPPAGMKVIGLTEAALLATSLPVKASPKSEL